jgi:hypothetical protein
MVEPMVSPLIAGSPKRRWLSPRLVRGSPWRPGQAKCGNFMIYL